jgi:membrane-associated phospholipid phosphatase
MLIWTTLLIGGLVVGVMGYSASQVRRGRWRHVDAVNPGERRDLNLVSGSALGAGSLLAAALGDLALAAGFGSAATIVALAVLGSSRLKLSQHVAFMTLATAVAASVSSWAMLAALVLTAGVAWSRLELGRHTRTEVGAGFVVGSVAAALFTSLRVLLPAVV